jgi:hypothetical protein
MIPIIGSLSIEHFRSLRQLKIEGLGMVNLITGRNNTGKSSILEALRILASGVGSPSVLSSILRYREEDVSEAEEAGIPVDPESLNQFSSLFTGFPKLSENREPIVLVANGGRRSMRLNISVGLFANEQEPDGSTRLVPQKPKSAASSVLPETELVPAIVLEDIGIKRILPMDHPLFSPRRQFRSSLFRSSLNEEPQLACAFISPYGGERTANLGVLWDKIALSDLEKEVVKALKIVAPEIIGISMVGGGGSSSMRTAIVRSSEFARPVPLRSFGDGLNRLFGIVLSLVNAKDGFLLIDEFENGMHHTVQLEVWQVIFRMSKLLNVQVFATSHSWDAVETFQQAAVQDNEQGLLIRLSRKGDAVIPTLFRDNELAVATRDRIEVR